MGIKNFIAEGIKEKVEEQMTILLDTSIISLRTVNELETDVVLIVDREDDDFLDIWFARIFKVLYNYSNLFKEWNGLVNKFNLLSDDIEQIVNDAKGNNFNLLFSAKKQART